MRSSWKLSGLVLLALVIGVGLGWVLTQRPAPVQAAEGDKPTAARYTVVATEGHNLIAVDNQTNTLYFYTIDKDAEIGSDLKLRGTVNLNDVGKEVIKPKVLFKGSK